MSWCRANLHRQLVLCLLPKIDSFTMLPMVNFEIARKFIKMAPQKPTFWCKNVRFFSFLRYGFMGKYQLGLPNKR